jgi:hypothetical protein
MTNNALKHAAAPPLPATVEELIADRKIKQERTLNDFVEDAYLALYEDSEAFRDFLRAVYDEQAVEGSLAADNLEAAALIREHAKEKGVREITREKKATIVKSLNVVLRRYAKSRKERKNMVHGQTVPENDSE